MNPRTAPAAVLAMLIMTAAACAPPAPEGIPIEPAPTGAGAPTTTCPDDSPGFYVDPDTGECWHIDTIPQTTTTAAVVEPGPATENTEVEYITMTTGPPVQTQTPPPPEEPTTTAPPATTTTTEPPPPTTTTTVPSATTTTTEPPPPTTTTTAPVTTVPPATTTTTTEPPTTTTTVPSTTTTAPAGPVVSIPQPGDDVPARNVYYRGEPEVDVTEFPPMANIIHWSDWNRPDREGTPYWGRRDVTETGEINWWSYPLDIRVGTVLYNVPGGADRLGENESYVVSRIRKLSDCSGGQYCAPHQGWIYMTDDGGIDIEENDVEKWLIRVCGIIPEHSEWGASWSAVGVREADGHFRVITGWWMNPSVGCLGYYA